MSGNNPERHNHGGVEHLFKELRKPTKFERFNLLVADVATYNNDYCFIDPKDKSSYDSNEITQAQKLQGLDIMIRNYHALRETGLGITISGNDDPGDSKASIVLRNGDQFSEFLTYVTEKKTGSRTRTSIGYVLNSLLGEIEDDLDATPEPSDEIQEKIMNLEKASEQFSEFYFAEAELLAGYVKYTKQGILPEFLLAKRAGLLNDTMLGESAPGEWHFELGRKKLALRWIDAFEILEIIKQNPNATDLYNEVFLALLLGAQEAKKELLSEHIERGVGEILDCVLEGLDTISQS